MKDILSNHSRDWDQYPLVLLVLGADLFSSIDIAIPYMIEGVHALLARVGVYIPLWIPFVTPAFALAIMYPRLGVPVVRSWVGEPVSRRAIILQTVLGAPILLTLTMLIEFGLLLPIQTIHIGLLKPRYIILYLIWTTLLDIFLGVWGGLVVYWIHYQIAHRDRYTIYQSR